MDHQIRRHVSAALSGLLAGSIAFVLTLICFTAFAHLSFGGGELLTWAVTLAGLAFSGTYVGVWIAGAKPIGVPRAAVDPVQ